MNQKERAERAIELLKEAKDCLDGSGGYAPVYNPEQKDELYKENGEKAGIYDICQWWIDTYPEDVFISDPLAVVAAREFMKEILSLRKKNEKKSTR